MSWVEPSVFFVVCANPRRGLNQRVFVVVNTASLMESEFRWLCHGIQIL